MHCAQQQVGVLYITEAPRCAAAKELCQLRSERRCQLCSHPQQRGIAPTARLQQQQGMQKESAG
jgi:hypothetical protein